MTDVLENVIWAAGFFDGEGCIQLNRSRRRVGAGSIVALQISAGQVAPEPLIRLQTIFGGTISVKRKQRGHWRQLHLWTLSGDAAAAALEAMRPYFSVKQAQAELVIIFQGRRHGMRRSDVEQARDDYDHGALSALKRGVPAPLMLPRLIGQMTIDLGGQP